MGLTKAQKYQRDVDDRRKWREYNNILAKKRQDRADRITAMEMLLDAVWDPSLALLVKITKSTHANGLASHWETFYNEVGEEVPRPKGYQSA